VAIADWTAPHYPLLSVESQLLSKEMPSEYLRQMAVAGLVCGYGTRGRVKKFQFLVDQDEAERAMQKNQVRVEDRARTPGDMLARMMADRQTVRRERIETRRGTSVLYWHKAVRI
jgi:hypothetical protein